MADDYGTVGLGGSLDGDVTYHFCYQATASFSIKVNTGEGATISATYQELTGGINSISSSSGGLTFPASTFCYVTITVTGGGTTYLS